MKLTISNSKRIVTLALVPVLMTLIIPFASAFTLSFGGRAFAVSVTSASTTLIFTDTGQLPSTGGEVDAVPTYVLNQFVSSDTLLSVALADQGRLFDSMADSQAAVAGLVLLPGTPAQITADFVSSEAFATCTGALGHSVIANLQLAGQQVTVSGQPNQTVTVPGVLTLVINEQAFNSNGLTVNALHLTTVDGTQVIVSSASSSESCSGVM